MDVSSSRVVDVGPLVLVQVVSKYLLSRPRLQEHKRGSGAVDKIHKIYVGFWNGSDSAKVIGLAWLAVWHGS